MRKGASKPAKRKGRGRQDAERRLAVKQRLDRANKLTERKKIKRFLMVGGIAFLVDVAVLSLATGVFDMYAEIARIPSFLAAVCTTWLLNRSFTFLTAAAPSWKEFVSYISAMTVGLIVNYGVFVLILQFTEFGSIYPALAIVPASAAGTFVNFLSSRHILDR